MSLLPTGSATATNTIGIVLVARCAARAASRVTVNKYVDIEPDEFISKSVKALGLFRRKAMVHFDILAFNVANVLQSLSK